LHPGRGRALNYTRAYGPDLQVRAAIAAQAADGGLFDLFVKP